MNPATSQYPSSLIFFCHIYLRSPWKSHFFPPSLLTNVPMNLSTFYIWRFFFLLRGCYAQPSCQLMKHWKTKKLLPSLNAKYILWKDECRSTMLCVCVPPTSQHDPDGGETINMLWSGEQTRMNLWKKESTGKKLKKKKRSQYSVAAMLPPPPQD